MIILLKSLKGSINSEDIITIVGGGNIGDMYDDIEYCRQFIIKQFPNNKIVIFHIFSIFRTKSKSICCNISNGMGYSIISITKQK